MAADRIVLLRLWRPPNALLFPVMDMMGRGFGAVQFGEAAAYGFILTAVIVARHRARCSPCAPGGL